MGTKRIPFFLTLITGFLLCLPFAMGRSGHDNSSTNASREAYSQQASQSSNSFCNQDLLLGLLKNYKKSLEKQNTTFALDAIAGFLEQSGVLPKKPFFFGSKVRNQNISLIHFSRSKDIDWFQFKQNDGSLLSIRLKNQPHAAIESLQIDPAKGKIQNLCGHLIPRVNTLLLQSPFEKQSSNSRFVDYLLGKFNVSSSGGSRSWNPSHFRTAASVADKHPRLLGMTNENLFGNLCTNFLSMDLYQRKAVIAKTVMSLAWAESQFNRNDKGDERRSAEKSMGVFQLSGNVRKMYGCSGTLTTVNSSSIDCVFRIFEKWGVSNSKTFWSVLRPHYVTKWHNKTIYNPMERRFMPTFRAYVPECKTSISAQPGHRDSKEPPGWSLVGDGLFNYVDPRS